VNTAFAWRNSDTVVVTGDGGAYQARFNNSDIAPGGLGHFVLEKFDPGGRTILLEIPDRFLGLNRLVIEDRGRSITVYINGINYGTIDVSGYSRPEPRYLVLTGGDRSGGDYFDNVKISR